MISKIYWKRNNWLRLIQKYHYKVTLCPQKKIKTKATFLLQIDKIIKITLT